ncbi:MAG TPA: phosphonate ABC transporter, permease protein PhnE [Pirellulales bacterium]|nr:phosphonate ABC transporter, permease protein PhnE [Pirellulales bacterium]
MSTHTFDAPGTRESVCQRYRQRWIRTAATAAVVMLVVLVSAWHSGLFDLRRLAAGVPDTISLLGEMWPPDFRNAGKWPKLLADTLTMSISGTLLSVVISAPLALLAARNTTPHPSIYFAARGVLNLLRAVPELILGIVLVAAVGFGVLPGVLALGLHSVGMVGKFYAEALEQVDTGPVEAVRAAGAGPFQVIWYGMLPQIMPLLAGVTIYRWEYHFRASTVMGMVGAGGIGLELMASLRLMDYREVAAILLVILVMVVLIDSVSSFLRHRFK